MNRTILVLCVLIVVQLFVVVDTCFGGEAMITGNIDSIAQEYVYLWNERGVRRAGETGSYRFHVQC